jgi:hypothetical protein
MEAVITTQYAGLALNVKDGFAYTAILTTSSSGPPTTGLATLRCRVLSQIDQSVLYEIVLATGMPTKVDGGKNVVTWGGGVPATVAGGGSVGDAEVMKIVGILQLVLEVEEQADNTSTVSIVLQVEDV